MVTGDDGLQEVLRRLDALPTPDIQSAAELARHEDMRFAARFGLRQPTFRPVVRLRFSGEKVQDHALDARVGSRVVDAFVDTVRAVATTVHVAAENARLFLSPQVLPGSTVLELVGDPRPEPDYSSPLVETIEDTPTDRVLESLFDTLEEVHGGPEEFNGSIEPTIGKPMYELAQHLIDGDVDLDVTWTRPRGRSREVMLARARSRQLRDILNRGQVETNPRTERGELVSISTQRQGSITVLIDSVPTTIVGTAGEEDRLRDLWAREVVVTWTETVHQHPQRAKTHTTRIFESIEAAPPAPPGQSSLYDD